MAIFSSMQCQILNRSVKLSDFFKSPTWKWRENLFYVCSLSLCGIYQLREFWVCLHCSLYLVWKRTYLVWCHNESSIFFLVCFVYFSNDFTSWDRKWPKYCWIGLTKAWMLIPHTLSVIHLADKCVVWLDAVCLKNHVVKHKSVESAHWIRRSPDFIPHLVHRLWIKMTRNSSISFIQTLGSTEYQLVLGIVIFGQILENHCNRAVRGEAFS